MLLQDIREKAKTFGINDDRLPEQLKATDTYYYWREDARCQVLNTLRPCLHPILGKYATHLIDGYEALAEGKLSFCLQTYIPSHELYNLVHGKDRGSYSDFLATDPPTAVTVACSGGANWDLLYANVKYRDYGSTKKFSIRVERETGVRLNDVLDELSGTLIINGTSEVLGQDVVLVWVFDDSNDKHDLILQSSTRSVERLVSTKGEGAVLIRLACARTVKVKGAHTLYQQANDLRHCPLFRPPAHQEFLTTLNLQLYQPTTMAEMRLATLTEYAKEHFPEDFAKLPPLSCMSVLQNIQKCTFTLRFCGSDLVTMSTNGYLHYSDRLVKAYEPFAYISPSFSYGTDDKLEAFLRFCFLLKGYNGTRYCFDRECITHFKSACADIANGVRAKEAAVDDPSRWGITVAGQSQVQKLQNRIQQLVATVDALKTQAATDYNTLKQKAENSEAKTKYLEQQFASSKTEAQAAKIDASKDGVDWMKQFAASKIEVEELKAKLMSAQAQIAKMEKENMELRK
ncbi:hypothetical protein OPT61_g7102 [Boeremia exigua]|uniref:Uncharacterized protein n=1 Tax=Boeremia exigua TaxID=749465 RepID=A0ACC2I3X2_9PLEO|nr:hypothetical protein OPT61_g7102 [Boeremia exigua]